MITPAFTGQIYRDTATGNIWKANSTTPGDWTLLVQDMGVRSNPPSFKISEAISPNVYWLSDGAGNPLNGTLVFNATFLVNSFTFLYAEDVTSISFPNLIAIDPNEAAYLDAVITDCPDLTSVLLPLLQDTHGLSLLINGCDSLTNVNLDALVTVGWILGIYDNSSIVSLSLPNLVTIANTFKCYSNANLTTISIPSFLPVNGKEIDFTGDALTLASVDHVLSRAVANPAYVSGLIKIGGGTNAAPTQGAGSAHDILEARGVTITHN